MEQRLVRIEDKLDKVAESQAEMTASLREHMRRTEIAESNIERLASQMQPVQQHVAFIRGLGKLITVLVAAGAALATIWQSFFGGK